jgi:hypothetical protein
VYSTIVELDFNHLLKFPGAAESVAPMPASAAVNGFLLWMGAGGFLVADYSVDSQVFTCRVSGLSIELSNVRAWAELPDPVSLV